MLFSRLAVGDGVGGAALAGGMTAERRWIVGHCHRCECCSLAAAAEQRGVLILKINAHKEKEEKEKEEENPSSRFLPSFPPLWRAPQDAQPARSSAPASAGQ